VLECLNKMWKITEDGHFDVNFERIFMYFLKEFKTSCVFGVYITIHTVLQMLCCS
jgi:hypothetical protein